MCRRVLLTAIWELDFLVSSSTTGTGSATYDGLAHELFSTGPYPLLCFTSDSGSAVGAQFAKAKRVSGLAKKSFA